MPKSSSRSPKRLLAGLPEPVREAVLASLVETAADGIVAVDVEQNILFFSRSAEQTLGYRADEVLGRSLALLLPSHVAPTHGEAVRQFAGTEAARVEMAQRLPVSARRKDGSAVPLEVTLSKLDVGGAVCIVAALRDVSVRRQAEEALRESEERYRSIVNSISEGIVMQDAGGRIVACNASAERILGLTLDQMMGRTSHDPRWRAVRPDGSPATAEEHPIVQTRLTGRPRRNVLMGVHRPDGVLVWTSVNTQPLFRAGEEKPYAVVASFTDVTEARAAERILRESEERYRTLFENSLDGVLLTAPDGRILAANQAACDLFGRTEEELRQIGRAAVVDVADPRLAVALAERARTGKFRSELTLMRKDGTRFPADVTSAVFTDHDGEQRTSMVVRDVSERSRAMEVLEQRVAERTRELSALLEVSRNLASMLELQPLLEVVLAQLRSVLDFDGAAIAILENESLRIVDYQGPLPRAEVLKHPIALNADSPYCRIILQREPVILEDVLPDAVPAVAAGAGGYGDGFAELRRGMEGIRSWMGVPLIAKGETIGLLRIDSSVPGCFTQDDARLVLAFAELAAVAIENAQLYRSAQQAAAQAAALEERHHLARELHDSVSQGLYGIVLGARTAQAVLERSPADALAALSYVLSLAQTSFAEMRELIFELLPDSMATEGLIARLGRHLDVVRARGKFGIQAELCDEPSLPLAAKEALYRIALEALNNVAKHAQAGNVTLRLCQEGTTTVLEIADDGVGFDPRRIERGHLGLRSMQERAERAGGTFQVESEAGKGTRVTVRVAAGDAPPP